MDQYFTVQPHTFMRQHIDHKHWYDRVKLSLKEIHKTQYVACMNPTAGSFTIDPRLQVGALLLLLLVVVAIVLSSSSSFPYHRECLSFKAVAQCQGRCETF